VTCPPHQGSEVAASDAVIARPVRCAVVALVLALVLLAAPAAAQTDLAPTTTAFDLSDCTGAITKPGCGEAPEESGDRGGSAQIFLFGLLAAGTVVGLVVIARGVRRNTRRRAEATTGDWS
jgi:hypothetical protein